MRIISFFFKITLLLLIPAFLISSCKDDDPDPTTATIHGTITLENANLWDTWKDSGEVQLTLFPEFVLAVPPAGKGWGVIPDNFFGTGVPGGTYAISAPVFADVIAYQQGTTQIDYEITVDLSNTESATFSAIALGLRHNTIVDASLRTATLGVHWGDPNTTSHGIVIAPDYNYPAPSTFTVERGDHTEINFKADFAFCEVWF